MEKCRKVRALEKELAQLRTEKECMDWLISRYDAGEKEICRGLRELAAQMDSISSRGSELVGERDALRRQKERLEAELDTALGIVETLLATLRRLTVEEGDNG